MKKKKVFLISIFIKYIINMKIIIEIQVIYYDFKVIIEDFWFYKRYFEELILKIEKIINNHDIKLNFKEFYHFYL